MAVLKGARVNKVGDSKFGKGKRWIAVKHEEYDGFLNVDDASIEVNQGDVLDIMYEQKGKSLIVTKVRPSGGGGGPAAPATLSGGGAPAPYIGGPSREQSIVMQHAQKVSAQLVTLFVDKGVIKLGAQAKQHAQLLELFDELSAHIFSTAQGAGLQAIVEEQAALKAELDPANDADADTPKEEPADKDAGGSDFDDEFDAN